jgi:hypothetical protein
MMMKKIIVLLYVVLALGAINLFTSCIGDLDAFPYNETDFTSENAYGSDYENYLSGLAKLYLSFSNTSGLAVDDVGASELVRAYWSIQECSSDACKNNWRADAWTQDINQNTWSTASNAATYAIYARTLHGITYTNEFLRQTTDDRLQQRGCTEEVIGKIHMLRQEARFIRAFMYFLAIDTFGDVPFVTEESAFGAVTPEVGTRSDVFDYIESELLDLVSAESSLGEPGSNYPRADKGSAWGLLSRLYLNAEVYKSTVDASGNVTAKGEPMWEECKKACEEIFKQNFGLCSNYFDLFRGDNGENPDANQEFLFSVYYDAENSRSWGGTIFLVQSSFQAADDLKDEEGNSLYMLGVADGWAGIRMPYEYASDYFGVTVPEDGYNSDGTYTGVYDYEDLRAANFWIKGHTEEMTDIGEFSQGWSFYKYNNIPHDLTPEEFRETAATYGTATAKASIDYPMIRLAEIYLNYAEASLHLNKTAEAVPYLNQLRKRAGLPEIASYDHDYLVRERAVELSWEGFRRSDLIRWDLFHSNTYLWKWKGGSYNGQGFPEYKLVFDFPSSELVSNSNLTHKPGYN